MSSNRRSIGNFLTVCLVILAPLRAVAASCCGGGAQARSLILGDDRYQLTTTFTQSFVVADALAGGAVVSRPSGDDETRQTFLLEASGLISDRWQLGLSVPVERRARRFGGQQESDAGLGETSLTVAYELLPEWNYSAWRPKIYAYAGALFPTGGSRFSPGLLWAIDARGRGFFALSAGVLLLKTISSWDIALRAEVQRPLARSFESGAGTSRYSPTWGASGSLAVGLSPARGPFRLGVSIAPAYVGPVGVSGAQTFETAPEVSWTFGAQASYLVSDELSLSATYSDAALFREAANTSLSRGFGLVVQKRWPR